MTAALAELSPGARTPVELAKKLQPDTSTEKKSGVLFVGETTIFHRPAVGIGDSKQLLSQGSRTISRKEFSEIPLTANKTEQTADNPGFNIGRRLVRLSNGPFTLYTWGTAGYATLITEQIGVPYRDMHTHIEETSGTIHEAVVFQADRHHRTDSITIDTPAAINSDFTDILDGKQKHVIISSLPEGDWRDSLRKGVQKLRDLQTSYSIILGDAQRKAIIEGNNSEAIYNALENANSLVVSIEDLRHLINGQQSHEQPSDNLVALMDQARRLLKSQYIFVAAGREGFIGGSEEGNMFVYADRAEIPVKDQEYMDAFIAGVVTDGDMQERLVRGSANASILVNPDGAHRNLPSQSQLDKRVIKKLHDGDVVQLPGNN